MSWSFDPEVPAGYQDVDIEMAEMTDAANWPTCSRCDDEVSVKAGDYNDEGRFVCNRCRKGTS